MNHSPVISTAPKMSRAASASSQQGLSLIEMVIFIIIVGVALASLAQLFALNVRHSATPLLRQKSVILANAYMEEIIRKRWDELTPDGGGKIDSATSTIATEEGLRSVYDDIDDYHLLSGAPTKTDGSTMQGFDGFSVNVAVRHPSAAWNTIAATEVKQITVTVSAPNGESLQLNSFRVNF
ncbi:MAG: hypothetical protein HQL49_03175 [Gammaproteobacteria bacterium]|nr:hypothetical protein [Gammaproteobacteria bacterium]